MPCRERAQSTLLAPVSWALHAHGLCVCWKGRGEQKIMSAGPFSLLLLLTSWKGMYGKVHLLPNLIVIVEHVGGS